MTKTIRIPGGILTLNESKAKCPKCNKEIPFDKIESKWMKQDNDFIRMKCTCKKYIGITTDFRGDYIAFDLKPPKTKLMILE